jgi:hypothetical protein
MKAFIMGLLALLATSLPIHAQYQKNEQLAARIKTVGQKQDLIRFISLAKTEGGRDIYMIRAGRGDTENKPGIAIIGGIDGVSLASTEIVMKMVEELVGNHSTILDELTFYFIPDVTPDASEQFFAPLRYERRGNSVSFDDDKDGTADEDGYDDLNNDGLVSWMRIHDPATGGYLVHPDNPAIMVKADVSKGQKGEYVLMHEGLDNDKDGKINEDIPGGTIFNKNFSFHYPYFEEGAGINAMSETETRSVAKFLFDHWNIFAILLFAPENNLSEYNDLKAELIDKNIPASISEKDKPYVESVVNLYKKNVHLSDSGKVVPSGGDMLSWAWFHYNRYAFSTPGWNVRKNKNNLGSAEFDFLKMAAEKNFPDPAVPWQKIDHPDFPGKTVEIGGIKPFIMLNPPVAIIDSVADCHLNFLLDLARMHPALQINNVKITRNAGEVYLLEAEMTNTGGLPTMPFLAVNSKWVKKIRLDILPSPKQTIAGGRKVFLYDRILPGETVKTAWLINGKGKVILKAGSPQTGYISKEVELN